MVLSVRGYAKFRGCSPNAVRKALKSGRLTRRADGKIDTEVADVEWQQKTRPAATATTDEEFQRARGARETYVAKLTQVTYFERTGKLVPVAEVQASAFSMFRTLRDAMIGIPDRLSAIVAAESDPVVVKALLTAEIRKACSMAPGLTRTTNET